MVKTGQFLPIWPWRRGTRMTRWAPRRAAGTRMILGWAAATRRRGWCRMLYPDLTIVLNTRRAKPGEAVFFDRFLPRKKLLDRQPITSACLVQGK